MLPTYNCFLNTIWVLLRMKLPIHIGLQGLDPTLNKHDAKFECKKTFG